jgi:hypothetical protein
MASSPAGIKIPKMLAIPSLFEPSPRDPLQIRPRLGVPSLVYIPKTVEDNQEGEEEKKESNKSSLNFKMEDICENNFMEEHLIIKNKYHINQGHNQPNTPHGSNKLNFNVTNGGNNPNANCKSNQNNNANHNYHSVNATNNNITTNNNDSSTKGNKSNTNGINGKNKEPKEGSELLGSIIPMTIEKSSSFGLTISEDS